MQNLLTWVSPGINDNGKIILNVNWEEVMGNAVSTMEFILNKGIRLILLIVAMYLAIKIGDKLIDKFVKNQIESKLSFSMNRQKAITVGAILKSSLKYAVYISGAAIIIGSTFKVSAAVLSAVGFVVGIGAQSLVKDLINGFFILFEDQYGVGDHVTIGTFSGIVETIGIRTTVIRDFSADVHLIPNGTINQVTNHSRGNIRFIVDVDISYEEDIDNAINVITNVCNKYKNENENIVEPIEVLGVNSLNASSVTIRIIGKTKPLKQWEAERELRKRVKKVLDEEGIEIPYPKTQLVNKEGDK